MRGFYTKYNLRRSRSVGLTESFNDGFSMGEDEGYETGFIEGLKEGIRLKVTGEVIAVNTFGRVL